MVAAAVTGTEVRRIAKGMRVLSRDSRLLGTVETISGDEFTMIDRDAGASARVTFGLVQSVDEDVHLNIGPCGLYAASTG